MKHYSVLCVLGRPDGFKSVDVYADNTKEAGEKAIKLLSSQGFPDAYTAPDYPEAPAVIELSDRRKYEVTLIVPSEFGVTEVVVKVLGKDADEAISKAISIEEFNDIHGCTVSRDHFGKPKVTTGWS